jgi:hypothetical protein
MEIIHYFLSGTWVSLDSSILRGGGDKEGGWVLEPVAQNYQGWLCMALEN